MSWIQGSGWFQSLFAQNPVDTGGGTFHAMQADELGSNVLMLFDDPTTSDLLKADDLVAYV